MCRYYDPELGRFLNADALVSTGQGLLGNNMFAYCRNNPVTRKDTSGTTDVSNIANEENGNIFDDYGSPKSNGGGAGTGGKGFDTFAKLKNSIGSPGAGKEWHHIVEQSQITKSGFDSQTIHNTDNIIALDKATHQAISGYYSSKQPFTNGMTVRNWLAGQSFGEQYMFGMEVIRRYM